MATKKAGTILLNLSTKQVALVYRPKFDDYSFPKGHLEPGESLQECAVRETEEETLRANHLLYNQEIYILKYTTPLGEEVENYMYMAIDDGPTMKDIPLQDREDVRWVSLDSVEKTLSYDNLKEFWRSIEPNILKIFENT